MTPLTLTIEPHQWGQSGPHTDSVYSFTVSSNAELSDQAADLLAMNFGRAYFPSEAEAPSFASPILHKRDRLSPQAVRYVVVEAWTD